MKKLLILCLTLTLLLCAAACGGSKTVDVDALAGELAAADIYDDLLSPLPDGMAERFYAMDAGELEKSVLYYGTGATAEEIAILQCRDEAAAAKAMENAAARIASQRASFESYVPAEVPKLDSAVVERSGVYVVVVVCADASAAQSIVDGYLK